MIVVQRGKEPNSLLAFRKQNPDAGYETDMPTDVLKDVRKQMWEVQKCLCAYCMKRMETPSVVRILRWESENEKEKDYYTPRGYICRRNSPAQGGNVK